MTYLIVIFVLRDHFERLPPDVTTSTVTFFSLLILGAFPFLLRFIRFADHFGFKVRPNSVHAFFGILDISAKFGSD
jgi:phenylalanine-4-hydroxylase